MKLGPLGLQNFYATFSGDFENFCRVKPAGIRRQPLRCRLGAEVLVRPVLGVWYPRVESTGSPRTLGTTPGAIRFCKRLH